MSLFSKKASPIEAQDRRLAAEIERLQSEMDQLSRVGENPASASGFKVRTTAYGSVNRTPKPNDSSSSPAIQRLEKIPDRTSSRWLSPDGSIRPSEIPPRDPHYNDLGVRKYDLISAWNRWSRHWRGPTASNPKMVSYLAAGSIHGLRPLRYEKRVARNRFIALFGVLLAILWGLAYVFLKQNGRLF